MISLQAQIDSPSSMKLRKMQREAPSSYRRAVVLALRSARSQIQAAIKSGGGKTGVPSFVSKSDMTVALHGKGKWFGSFQNSSVIKAWRSGGVQHVGFIDKVSGFAGKLQNSESFVFGTSQRHALHKMGLREVPEFYSRPERLVIDPYRSYLESSGRLAEWIAALALKILAGKIGMRGAGVSRAMSRARSKGYAQVQGRE